MRSRTAALGSALFFLVAPCVVAGVVPWTLTRWRPGPYASPAAAVAGSALVCAGLPVLLEAFVRFARAGRGTPSPTHPPEHLVVSGAYRYVRNPMYVAVLAIIAGQALLLGRTQLWSYAAGCALFAHLFVVFYEEPTLRDQFGADYERYTLGVRRWWPRLRPWRS